MSWRSWLTRAPRSSRPFGENQAVWTKYPEFLRTRLEDNSRSYHRVMQWDHHEIPKDDLEAIACLPTLVCNALNGDPQKAQATNVAWALLYDASRLMDHIQDGQLDPSFPHDQAISTAVALYFTAAEHLGRLPIEWQSEAYGYLAEMVSGQAEDVIKEPLTAQEALGIVEKKAGAFMALGCVLGGRCADAAPQTLQSLAHYGRALGTMIQIQNDLEFIEALGAGKRHQPERLANVALAYTRQNLSPEQRETLRADLEINSQTVAAPSVAATAYTTLVRTGARMYCVVEAAKYWDLARTELVSIKLVEGPERKVLFGLVDGVINGLKAQT